MVPRKLLYDLWCLDNYFMVPRQLLYDLWCLDSYFMTYGA